MPTGFTATEKKEQQLLLRRATLEQQLRSCRMELKAVAVQLAKERKASVATAVLKRPRSDSEQIDGGLKVDPVSGGMCGWSKEDKCRYGPGFACWQCMHRARGGKCGHYHTCGKKPYAR